MWPRWLIPVACLTPASAAGQWLDLDVPTRPPSAAALVEAGRDIYERQCWYCHGDDGDGTGPVAEYLWPRPRDFTLGSFKLRTTTSGELPTDDDLFRTVSRGIPGTAMPEWESVLSADERWQVIAYVKTFADGMFEDEEFDPDKAVIDIGPAPTPASELIAAGRQVFEQSDCWECHGAVGRGDGQKAPDLTDDWGYPIWATDLAAGWKFKGGSTPRDVYARLSSGLDGSPMPSYAQTLTDEERWQVAHYTTSLIEVAEGEDSRSVVITASRVRGALPTEPNDGAWNDATDIGIPLTGQATFAPRWQTPAVTDIAVRALHNGEEIALRLQWNDRTLDSVPGDPARAQVEGWTADDTYPVIFPDGARARGIFADAVEAMFPVGADVGPVLPHFVYGDQQRQVDLWRWRGDAAGRVTEYWADGPEQHPREHPGESQHANGAGSWVDGRWTVVVRRSLTTPDRERDVQFQAGQYVPIAFHVWDGSNGETGLRMSLSSWYFLYLAEPVRVTHVLLVLVAVLGVATVEYGAVRVLRARR